MLDRCNCTGNNIYTTDWYIDRHVCRDTKLRSYLRMAVGEYPSIILPGGEYFVY